MSDHGYASFEDWYEIRWTRAECMDRLRKLTLPRPLPLHAIECILSLAETHYVFDMLEDLQEETQLVTTHLMDLMIILNRKASAVIRAVRCGLPLQTAIAHKGLMDFSLPNVLPGDPCEMSALGRARVTLETETAFCYDELSTIVHAPPWGEITPL